jgi:hypothetical protein
MLSFFLVLTISTAPFLVSILLHLIFCRGVLNSAASLIRCVRRRDHVTRPLQNLNWLPIRRRIDFKLAVLAYRCCVDVVTVDSPPPMLKLLCPTLPFLPDSFHLPHRSVRNALRPALFIPFFALSITATKHSLVLAHWYGILPPSVFSSPSVSVFRSRLKTVFPSILNTRFMYKKLVCTILSTNTNPRWNNCVYCNRTLQAGSI